MADETQTVITPAPVPASVPVAADTPKYPRLRNLAEIVLSIALGYLSARYGIPLATAQAATAEAPAPAEVHTLSGPLPTAYDYAAEAPAEVRTLCGIGIVTAEDVVPTISGKTEYPAHSLVRLKAEGVKAGAAVLWRVSPREGISRATTKPELLEFAAAPGTYDVELLVMRQAEGGALDVQEVFTRVTIGAAPKPDPKPQPDPKGQGKLDPPAALARIQFGSSGCTATVIGPRRADGRWDVLTASHCMPGVGSKGSMKLKDGRSFAVRVVVHEKTPDLAWMITESATVDDMPYANLAASNPTVGTKVWHAGYGVDVPGNREDGEVSADPDSNGQTRFVLNVSPGDSGGGILRSDTNEVVSTVCCTAGLARKTSMWGASVAAVRKARPGVVRLDELPEPPAGAAPQPECCH